jgi:transcription initiation factor TFIID subunit 10
LIESETIRFVSPSNSTYNIITTMDNPSAQRDPIQDQDEEELDTTVEADVDMTEANPNANDFGGDGTQDIDPVAPAAEIRVPTKKDASLREFLGKMDEFAPIV